MKSHRETLTFEIQQRMDFVNITPDVDRAVEKSGVRDGLCLVNAMHITASVFINDDEPGLHADYKRWLDLDRTRGPLQDSHASVTTRRCLRGLRRAGQDRSDDSSRERRYRSG